tara:strand:- start:45 stop:515 length:471 start_codon:yes stop_codon:yes gene_type:complete
MNISAKIEITDEQIRCLLNDAFEQASNYWYDELDKGQPSRHITLDACDHVLESVTKEWEKYWWAYLPTTGGSVTLVDTIADTNEGRSRRYEDASPPQRKRENGFYTIDAHAIERGVQALSEKCPHQFANAFLLDNADAMTADAFLQCCCFGDVLYG